MYSSHMTQYHLKTSLAIVEFKHHKTSGAEVSYLECERHLSLTGIVAHKDVSLSLVSVLYISRL